MISQRITVAVSTSMSAMHQQCAVFVFPQFLHFKQLEHHYSQIDVLVKIKDRFSIQIPPSLPFRFIHIPKKRDPSTFKRLTLIAESIDTIKLAWNALHQFTPHIFVDTTGCAFTFLVAKLARCKIVAYVHYPTVSTVSSSCKYFRHHYAV